MKDYRYAGMTSKLTVYIKDSLRQQLKDAVENKSLSQLVSDALESYLSAELVKDLSSSNGDNALPSLSEVVKRRPKGRGSSAEIIAIQRRGRNDRPSRQ
jgi:hypothetical protein